MDNIKKMILEEEAKGNIVVADGTGLYATSLKERITELEKETQQIKN